MKIISRKIKIGMMVWITLLEYTGWAEIIKISKKRKCVLVQDCYGEKYRVYANQIS